MEMRAETTLRRLGSEKHVRLDAVRRHGTASGETIPPVWIKDEGQWSQLEDLGEQIREAGIADVSNTPLQASEAGLSKHIYQLAEVAQILEVHPSTVTKFIRNNVLAGVQVGGRYVWVVGASLRRLINGEHPCTN